MEQVTALGLETAAFAVLNVFQPGEAIPNDQAQLALGFLNRMVGGWALRSFTIPAVARLVFPLIANKGGPSNPYSVGLGGDLNIQRPVSQSSFTGAGLLLATPTPNVEIPRALATDDGYRSIQIKELTSTLFTTIYYNPTFSVQFGTLQLWPVPDNALHSLVLYLQQALSTFATLQTVYNVPDGYGDALTYNLARRLAKPWGATVDDDLAQSALLSLNLVQRANVKLTDLANDIQIGGDRRHDYNIQTGAGG